MEVNTCCGELNDCAGVWYVKHVIEPLEFLSYILYLLHERVEERKRT